MSHDLWILILQGLIGPAALGVVAFCWFYSKAGDKIIAEKNAEIRRLSEAVGETIPLPTEPAILISFGGMLRRNAGNIIVLLAALAFGFVVNESIQAKREMSLANQKLAAILPSAQKLTPLEKEVGELERWRGHAVKDTLALKDQVQDLLTENERLKQRNRDLLIALEKVCSMSRGPHPVECKVY